jgi:hypothetical protein
VSQGELSIRYFDCRKVVTSICELVAELPLLGGKAVGPHLATRPGQIPSLLLLLEKLQHSRTC